MIICVQGLGYIGSAMSVAIALAKNKFKKKNLKIIGVEKPTIYGKQIISKINSGIFPFKSNDLELKQAMKKIKKSGVLQATSSSSIYKKANVLLVSINCDLIRVKGKLRVDLFNFKKSIIEFAEKIRENTLVIIESTVPPGTCEKIVYPTIKKVFLKRKLNVDKIYLAHSYERVTPGKNYLSSIIDNYRVYSGINKKSEIRCKNFLSKIVNVKKYPLTKLMNITSSETCKLMENSYRAVNIAFIDEWLKFSNQLNLNLFDIINAIKKRKTHNNIMLPGLGVGGYCLTKDPLFAKISTKQVLKKRSLNFPLCSSAIDINHDMPNTSMKFIELNYKNKLKEKKALFFGISYKNEIGDLRYSPSLDLIKKFMNQKDQNLLNLRADLLCKL